MSETCAYCHKPGATHKVTGGIYYHPDCWEKRKAEADG